jgi:hypothetical protein
VTEDEQRDGHANQRVGILVRRDTVVPQSAPKSEERNSVRVVTGDIVFQVLHSPDIFKDKAGNVHIGTASHDDFFRILGKK